MWFKWLESIRSGNGGGVVDGGSETIIQIKLQPRWYEETWLRYDRWYRIDETFRYFLFISEDLLLDARKFEEKKTEI